MPGDGLAFILYKLDVPKLGQYGACLGYGNTTPSNAIIP